MKDLIKQIRLFVKMSQSEMAKKIGVSFATINRWENGRSVPTRLAEEKLYEMCEEFNIPVYDMIIEKAEREASGIKTEKNRILLYHGSKSGIKGGIAPISREKCDFGKGFYMGDDIRQPLTLICGFEESRLYVVSIDTEGLSTVEIPTNIDWAMLVAYHRGKMEKIKGSDFYNKYASFTNGKDLVIGSIADDRMFFVLDNFFQENITDMALLDSLSALRLGRQYVAITEKACRRIKIEKEIQLSFFEKTVIGKMSEDNRQRGISMANEICRKHRRDGRYFDEIIKEL